MSGLVERFHRHAASQTGIPDKRTDVEVLALRIPRDGHSKRGRKGCRRVTRTERVVRGFLATQEAAQSARLLDGVKLVTPSGQDLVRVRLMTHVPDKPVIRRIENIMH